MTMPKARDLDMTERLWNIVWLIALAAGSFVYAVATKGYTDNIVTDTTVAMFGASLIIIASLPVIWLASKLLVWAANVWWDLRNLISRR